MYRQVVSDLDILMAAQTGTRIPGGGQSVVMINPDQIDRDRYAAEFRIDRALSFLAEALENPSHNVPYDDLDMAALRRDVDAYLSRID